MWVATTAGTVPSILDERIIVPEFMDRHQHMRT